MPCDVCGLPDPYNGQGDGIGSCDCPRCDGCDAAAGSEFCACPDFDIWEPLDEEPEPAISTVYLPGDQPS